MKKIKSLSKIIIALLMALALTTLTACDMLDDFFGKGGEEGGTGDGNEYQVVLETDGGTFTESLPEYYTSGIACDLPANGTKEHYTFDGWYEDSSFSGKKVTKIPTGATGDKTYYARWNPETYNITYSIKSDTSFSSDITSYTYNTLTDLPAPTKPGYTFNGWYTNSDLSGSAVKQIAAGDFGDKTFYGEWVSQGASAKKWTVTLNDNGGTYKGAKITEYTEGIGAALPQMEKDNCDFDGWCENKNLSGNPVFSISSSATGNKEYWAKFTPISADALQLSAYGGYEEGAYVEFDAVSGLNENQYSVEYKASDANSYTAIDKELIRVNSGKVRADVVGLKAGNYSLKIVAGTKSATKNVTVESYDRSGYAHFNYTSGVGGYKDDGTPKSNAETIYVTEATKNKVALTIKNKEYKGLVNILQNLNKDTSKSYIIRIIGRISAYTWNYKDAAAGTESGNALAALKETYPYSSSSSNIKVDQNTLISKGYNTLNTSLSGVTENLNGLSSNLIIEKGTGDLDSCWNDCSIGGSSSLTKNVTVEGIGTDAELFQWGMTWAYASSIEIRNLTFTDYTEDACSFQGADVKNNTDTSQYKSNNLWVHNCTFNRGMNYWDVCGEQDKHDGDGATDFKNLSNVTVSYNRYYYNHKTGLVGSGSTSYTANVTFHHNFYDQCQSRLPMGRQANIHMYNNYYRATSDYCLSARNNMYAFVEACYFENCNDTIRTESGAVVKLWNCDFVGKKFDSKHAITEATSRGQTVDNNNFMNRDGKTSGYSIDNDSTLFYLNSNGTTKALLDSAIDAKWKCVNKAGVHKSSSWVEIIKTDKDADVKLNQAFPLIKK